MSLLLDALRKADQERRLGEPPSAFSVPPPSVNGDGVPASRYRMGAWLCAVVALCFSALWLQSTVLRVDDAPAIEVQPAPVAAPFALEAEEFPWAEGDPAFEGLDSLDEMLIARSTPSAPTAPRQVTAGAASSPAIDEVPAGVPATRGQTPAESLAPEASNPTTATALPSRVESISLALPPGVRRLADLPDEMRARVPLLRIDVHAWNADPARRFVLVNGARYREGERTAEGVRLLAIVDNGIVIEVDGERVLIPRPG